MITSSRFLPLSVVKGKLYLFGGVCRPDATECLPGVYSFDIGEDEDEEEEESSSFCLNMAVMMMFPFLLPVSLTWDRLATGGVAPRTLGHSSVAVGDNIYVYGGNLGGSPTDDLLVFSTGPENKTTKTHTNRVMILINVSSYFTSCVLLFHLFQCLSPGRRLKPVDRCLRPCETLNMT